MFKRIYIILLTININSIHAMRIFSKGGSKTIISSSLKQNAYFKNTLSLEFKQDNSNDKLINQTALNILGLVNNKNNTKLISKASQTRSKIKQKNKIEQPLINKVEDINIKDTYGQTLLMRAISTDNCKIVQEIINAKADVNAKDNYGRTALMYAVESNNLEVVILLIQAKANVNAQDNSGKASLIYAANKQYNKYLSQTSDKKILIKLAQALQINNNIAQLLIETNSNLNLQDDYGYTALHYSAISNNERIAEILIDRGAFFNIKNNHGESPLKIALEMGSSNVLKLIWNAYFNIGIKETDL